MKRILGLVAVAALALAACNGFNNANSAEAGGVNTQQAQYEKAQPVPYYDYSLQRQALIDIYNAQNRNTQTWDIVTSYAGSFLFECEAVGWPIPVTTQLTNPWTVSNGGNIPNTGAGNVAIGQAEPNGTYSGNTQGTYILCIRPDGKVAPVYTENNVQMFPYAVHWDAARNAIVDDGGKSNITLDVKDGGNGHAAQP